MNSNLTSLVQLLMGAAFADKRLDGRELRAARRIVLGLLRTDRLPRSLSDMMVQFDPAGFNLEEAVAPLRGLSNGAKRRVVELIATINEADDHIDLSEDVYLEAVATSLGLEPSEFADLTLDGLEAVHEDIIELTATDLTEVMDES